MACVLVYNSHAARISSYKQGPRGPTTTIFYKKIKFVGGGRPIFLVRETYYCKFLKFFSGKSSGFSHNLATNYATLPPDLFPS